MAKVVQKRLRGMTANAGKHTDQNKHQQSIRVAAYCRVSTDSDIQLGSLDTQMKVFRQRINDHPNWELVGIYADEGVTGTSVKRRKEFLRMIQDAKNGKIDYIITKSISRFARNTIECLNYVRELKAKGVYILFEKENIDTKNDVSEMVLTVLAAFAQEESRSISDHVKWGVRKRFEQGVGRWAMLYGYRRGENDDYEIMEPEADVVRRVFRMYINGYTLRDIANALNEEGIQSPTGKRWYYSSISEMLSNERYSGDIVLQKYVIKSLFAGQTVRNNETEIPSYYVEDHHKAIISSEEFQLAQRIKEMRKQVVGQTSQYPYADTVLICPHCGHRLTHRKIALKDKSYAWGCFNDDGCGSFGIRDRKLNEHVAQCYRKRWNENAPGNHAGGCLGVSIGWLTERVDQILPSEQSVTVLWKDGTETTVDVNYTWRESKPADVAAQYKRFLTYCPDGKYKPVMMRKEDKKA